MNIKKLSILKNKLYVFIVSIYFTILSNPIFTFAKGKTALKENFEEFANQYKYYIAIFIAIGILTGILGFIVNFIKLGHNSTNPRLRQEAIKNLMVCAITTILLTNFGFVLGFYFKIILG